MPVEVKLPKLSMTMQEAQVVEWLVAPGESVESGQPLVTLEVDKATVDLEAPEAGVVKEILVPAESVVEVGAALAVIAMAGESAPIPPESVPAEERVPGRRKISPLARRLAAEHGLDLDQIEGTGPGGAVVAEDVRALVEAKEGEAGDGEKETEILPLGSVQRSMARRMVSSHQTIVPGTTITDVDMSEVARQRKGLPAGFTAFVIAAASRAVREFPLINATLEGDAITLKKHVHMGVAVQTERGLLVPVIRHAESKSLARIHQELQDLATRARDQTLKIEELGDPTLTVTNSGALGALLFAPVVTLPQSATLGMGRVEPTPVVRAGRIVIREIMYLCLSYDHRFLDGGVAVRYLQRVRASLENPLALLEGGEEPAVPQ